MAHPRASLVTSDLATAVSTAYEKKAEDNVYANTLMHKWGSARPTPKGNSTIQLHRFENAAANTATLTEGEIGAGVTIDDLTWTMSPAYYGDFVTFTEEVDDRTYSMYRAAVAANLGERAALGIDATFRALFDTLASGSADVTPYHSALSRAVIGQVVALMANQNVKGGEPDGSFGWVCSPLAAFDLLFDRSAGEVMDLSTGLGDSVNRQGVTLMQVLKTAGATIYTSTLVASPASTTRRSYVFGKNAYAYTHVAGKAPQFGTSANRNFRLRVHNEESSKFDPMGRIKGSMAYTYTLGVAFLDEVTYRMRITTTTTELAA